MMLKPRGQTVFQAKHSASRHCGLGLKVLASASNQNLASSSISLLIHLLIMCYTQAFINVFPLIEAPGFYENNSVRPPGFY